MSRKTVYFLLVIGVLTLLLLPTFAHASDTGVPGLTDSFFSWEMIGTYSGAVAVVVFVVQLLKLPIDRIWHIPTQYVVYVVSLVVLLLAQAFVPTLGGLSWKSGILSAFNAILVALTAMSAYAVTIEQPELDKYVSGRVTVEVESAEEVKEIADNTTPSKQ